MRPWFNIAVKILDRYYRKEESVFGKRNLKSFILREKLNLRKSMIMLKKWNNSDEPCTLREYLGLNAQEEDVWIEDSDEALQELLDSQKKGSRA